MCAEREPQTQDELNDYLLENAFADDDEECIEDMNKEINRSYINTEVAALNAMLHR